MILDNSNSRSGLLARFVFLWARKIIFFQTQRGRAYPSRFSLKLLQYSADHGHVCAMSQLGGLLFQCGVGRADKRSGLEYIRCAAKKNDCQAQFLLGKAYHKGQLINQDTKSALHWLALAADKGHKEAQSYLNVCLDAEQSSSAQSALAT